MHKPRHINPSSSALWASAFVVMALVIIQAGKLPGNRAEAGTADSNAGYSLVTANSGQGGDVNPNEVVYVLDNRAQTLLVYEIEDANSGQIFLRDGGSLVNLFNSARR